MSTDNERQVRDGLSGALDTITPAVPPVGAVLRQGRGLRRRRRLVAVAALAAVVVAGAIVPGLVARPPAPAAAPYYRLTYEPPGPGAPSGLIASGTINGHGWRVRLSDLGGTEVLDIPGFDENDVSGTPDGMPANLDPSSDGAKTVLTGTVARNVATITVTMRNGTTLTLQPVRWRGQRWVALTIPTQLPIVRIAAWSARGQIAYAVPYQDGPVTWLKPGQQGPRRAVIDVASGVVSGHPWRLRAFVGPWGRCFGGTADFGACISGLSADLPRDKLVSDEACGGFGNAELEIGAAALSVRSLRLRMSDGSVVRVRPVVVGRGRYFAFTVPNGARFTGWTAYGGSGQQIATGPAWEC